MIDLVIETNKCIKMFKKDENMILLWTAFDLSRHSVTDDSSQAETLPGVTEI